MLSISLLLPSCLQLQSSDKEKIDICDLLYQYTEDIEGTPYKLGSSKPSIGIDCSGFIYYMSKQMGNPIPRTTARKYYIMIDASKTHWQESECGYLVWWTLNNTRPFGHIGIMLEDNEFSHASSSRGLIISEFHENNYWDNHFETCKIKEW